MNGPASLQVSRVAVPSNVMSGEHAVNKQLTKADIDWHVLTWMAHVPVAETYISDP